MGKVTLSFFTLKLMFLEFSEQLGYGFPDSSVGKESACKAGDPPSIPGSGRSPGEGIDYSLQYSWGSLVAQLIKNPPALWVIWVGSMGWEEPLVYMRPFFKIGNLFFYHSVNTGPLSNNKLTSSCH